MADSNQPSPTFEDIDLSAYADPNVEAILIRAASRGDDARLAAIKAELRREENRRWCDILMMTDDLAVVRWHDDFVLTLKEPAIALAAKLTGGPDA